jgi:hypothetical protein
MPVAVADGYDTPLNTALVVAAPGVMANDYDPSRHAFTAVLVSNPTNGSLGGTFSSNGSFTYTPNASYLGLDSFTYQVTDGTDTSAPATVTIAVHPQYPLNLAFDGGCVNESNGLDNNCTANDLTFVELGLGTQTDGCVNSADRVTIYLRAVLRNTTAQTRYDVGTWFPLPDVPQPSWDPPDPGTPGPPPWDWAIDPEADGAYTGQCGVVGLMNPEPFSATPPPPTELCWFDTPVGALDLDGSEWARPGTELGHGPWVNDDGVGDFDPCGDIFDDDHKYLPANPGCDFLGDGDWDDSVIIFDSTFDLDCNDEDLSSGTSVLDGFVSTPVCLTWGNQPNQVDDDDPLCADPWCNNNLCDVQEELRPGTKSKCRCEEYQLTNIPSPELSLACSMPTGVTEMRPGGFVEVQVTYTNSCTCVEDPATPERFKCCTASYVQFPILYNDANGHISNISADNGIFVDDGLGTLTWTPEVPSYDLGVIAQSQTATITFYYHDDTGTASGLTDIVTVSSAWSDYNAFDPDTGGFTVNAVTQAALNTPCQIFFNPTWATISNLKAEVRDARTVVSWESSAEVGSVGYNVLRADADGEQWIQVNERLLPAIGDGPGGHYQFVDDSAPIEGTVTYKVVEVDAWGGAKEAPPVTVELSQGEGKSPSSRFVTEHRRPSARMTEAIEKSTRLTSQVAPSAKTHRRAADARIKPSRSPYLKIGVSETGMYRVSTSEIATAMGEREAKIKTRIAQHQLAMTTGGQQVAWLGEPDETGIVFFGQAPDSIYSAEKTYMLSKGQGLAIEQADGDAPQAADEGGSFPEKVAREENLLMRPFNVIEEGQDFWFWSGAIAEEPGFEEKRFEFELENVSEVDLSASLTVTFVGFGYTFDAGGSIKVNDHHVGYFSGPVFSHQSATFEFDQAFLKNGINSVDLIGQQAGILIDRFDIGYHRDLRTSTNELLVRTEDDAVVSISGFTTAAVDVYDVSDPLRPVLLPVGTHSAVDGSSIVASFSPTTADGKYLALGVDAVRQPSSIVGRTESTDLRKSQPPSWRAPPRSWPSTVRTTA